MDWLWLLPVLFPAVGFFWANCPCCGEPCYLACPGTPDVPASYTVDISGVSAGTCADCGTVLNGTHVLDFHEPNIGANACSWRAPVITACGSGGQMIYNILCSGCGTPATPHTGTDPGESFCQNAWSWGIHGRYNVLWAGYGEVVLQRRGNTTLCSGWPSTLTMVPA